MTSVELDSAGRLTSLPIVNNSVYADLNGLHAGDAIALHAAYDNGACVTILLPPETTAAPSAGAARRLLSAAATGGWWRR